MSNKTFWLISMLLVPWLAPIIYLFQRKKLQPGDLPI
ncbi:PLDc N-terminal domain-containing protein [Salinimicrobium terrae]